jgi:hypothetical protein
MFSYCRGVSADGIMIRWLLWLSDCLWCFSWKLIRLDAIWSWIGLIWLSFWLTGCCGLWWCLFEGCRDRFFWSFWCEGTVLGYYLVNWVCPVCCFCWIIGCVWCIVICGWIVGVMGWFRVDVNGLDSYKWGIDQWVCLFLLMNVVMLGWVSRLWVSRWYSLIWVIDTNYWWWGWEMIYAVGMLIVLYWWIGCVMVWFNHIWSQQVHFS